MEWLGPLVNSVGVPALAAVASAAALVLLGYVSPTVRWARRIKKDGEIAATLSDGDERNAWTQDIERRARRLRLYRQSIPRGQRAMSWVSLALLLWLPLAIFLDLQAGAGPEEMFVLPDLIIGIPGAIGAAVVSINLVRGRSAFGTTPEGYAEWEAKRQDDRQSELRLREVRRRARRVVRSKREPAPSTKAATETTE